MAEIYKPAEDSFFFSDILKKELQKIKAKDKIKLIDMGCGSCILADTAKEIGIKNITCTDINPNAIKLAKNKGYNAIKTNLFNNINEKYDIIVFNAPYLPEDKREPKTSQQATTGGKNGDEIPLKFIEQAKHHLNKSGKIYLLISNLTPIKQINKHKPKIIAKKKIFFEELIILKIS